MLSRRGLWHRSTASRPLSHAQWRCSRFASTAAAPRSKPSPDNNVSVGRLAFDASKAGLSKVDKAHVQSVIEAASKGSAFFQSEQRKAKERAVRHDAIVAKLCGFKKLPAAEQQAWKAKAEASEAHQEATRDFSRRFIHVDLDMFYAAVEEKLDPTLKDRPFAVGGFAMLATSNYIARQFGVRSGMPGFIAKKLCPQLWIIPPHFDVYRVEAATVRRIAATYDPLYVTVGLDELTMDVTDYLARHNATKRKGGKLLTAEDVCAEFRAAVEAATQLTCSGGISHSAAFAKLASNVKKPNGQHATSLHTREDVLQHVRDMTVRDVPGVGSATEHQLNALGIRTCGDLLTRKVELCYLFREKTFTFFLCAGLGLVRTHVDRTIAERSAPVAQGTSDTVTLPVASNALKAKPKPAKSREGKASDSPPPMPVRPPLLQKSTGKSVTVARGFPTTEAFRMRLRHLVKGAHEVMRSQGAGSQHVSFSTVDHSFTPHSYSATLPRLTADYGKLHAAIAVLAEPFVSRHRDFRLIGVNLSQLRRLPVAAVAKQTTKPATKSHHYPKRRTPLPIKTQKPQRSAAPAAPATKKKTKVCAAAQTRQRSHSKKARVLSILNM